jgi:hypothetical protein
MYASAGVVPAPVDHLFVPNGFDNNDNVEMVVTGKFPTNCYSRNKVETKVELRFDVMNSPSLPSDVKFTLLRKLASRMDQDGVLILTSQTHRSQIMNRDEVTEKFQLDSPRGLDSNGDSLYVCFGSQLKNCGLATYSVTNSVRTFLLTYYSYAVIPLNVLYSGSLYLTMENSNTLFRNSDVFSTASFVVVKNYNNVNITQSVVATNPACLQNPAYRGLINLRTVGSNPNNPIPPVLNIVGRTSGSNIQFNMGIGTSYESLQMRRKAETLQYRKNANDPGIVFTKKEQFKDVVSSGGNYNFSRAQLLRLLQENANEVPCSIGFNNGQPVLVTPPSKSGIVDTQFEGYYLDPYVTYYPSL